MTYTEEIECIRMKCKVMIIQKEMKEKDFPEYIKSKSFGCIRLTSRNLKKIISTIRELGNYVKNINFNHYFIQYDLKECIKVGSPDFFIYNQKKFFLCEFKSNNDSLNIKQIIWFEQHKNLPLLLALCDKTLVKD